MQKTSHVSSVAKLLGNICTLVIQAQTWSLACMTALLEIWLLWKVLKVEDLF